MDGYMGLGGSLYGPKAGRVGFAVTQIYSSVAREATFALGGDRWFILKVNGQTYVDQSVEGRRALAAMKGSVRVRVPLRAGWNKIVMKVGSGSLGFGFWCQVTDPGDLRVAPTIAAPEGTPAPLPSPGELLSESVTQMATDMYVEPLTKVEDPYGYIIW